MLRSSKPANVAVAVSPVDEQFLVRTLSVFSEQDLLSWIGAIEENDVLGAGAKLAKGFPTRVSDSLIRHREHDKQTGRTNMTLWDAPRYLVTQSTA
jgi:hypothetical protein